MKLSPWLTALRISLFGDTNSNRDKTIPNDRATVGRLGEKAARTYLRKRGWRLIAKNVRFGHDELDILAVSQDEQTLAIIEVRSTASANTRPEDTITNKKRAAMLRVARGLSGLAKKHDYVLRVDVISVQLRAASSHIDHFENVFPIGQARNSL